MASLQSCAWVAIFIYMWYQHTQDAHASMKKLELPCSFQDGTSLNAETNLKSEDGRSSCCRNADTCASTIFSRGACSKKDRPKNICASVCTTEHYQSSTIEVTPCDNARDAAELCENPATGLQPTNYLRIYTVMIVCSMVVIPGFQLLIFRISDEEQKGEKSEEEQEDSSDEYLEFLEDDED